MVEALRNVPPWHQRRILARFVAGVCDRKFDVIHIDGNPLNCQKANLVVVTRGVASAKARKTRTRESTSTYKA